MEYGHDTLAEFLRLDLANDPWDEERPVYMKYLKQKMDVLPSLPVDAALLEELEGVAMMARNYPKDFPYMEQLKELEASTAARAPKGFEEQLALIHSQVYPPHVLQVGVSDFWQSEIADLIFPSCMRSRISSIKFFCTLPALWMSHHLLAKI